MFSLCVFFFQPFFHWLLDLIPLNTVTVQVCKGARNDNPFVCRLCQSTIYNLAHTCDAFIFLKKESKSRQIVTKFVQMAFSMFWRMVRIPHTYHDKSLLFFSFLFPFCCYSSFTDWKWGYLCKWINRLCYLAKYESNG